jgi:YD repeat-containing protein
MKLKNFLSVLPLLAGLLFLFSGCDKDEPGKQVKPHDPSYVFTGKRLQAIGDLTFTYDSYGYITTITNDVEGMKIQIENTGAPMTPSTRALGSLLVYIDITGPGYPEEGLVLQCAIGKNGFILDARDIREEGADMRFEYNPSEQLTGVTLPKRENEEWKLTYANGNVTDTWANEGDPKEVETATISYTSDAYPKGIENKGGFMDFEGMFNVNMEEMQYAYYAGLMGKPTKLLPLQTILKGMNGDGTPYTQVNTYNWTLDADGYPTTLVINEDDEEVANVNLTWK